MCLTRERSRLLAAFERIRADQRPLLLFLLNTQVRNESLFTNLRRAVLGEARGCFPFQRTAELRISGSSAPADSLPAGLTFGGIMVRNQN
jgi:hypothetical protein